ncbi:MAG: hypothetical protein ACTHYT_09945 [Agrococcus casei]|uniref:hypothetical protein n=1 Tax=Agrococcus casei TaxID=343512 RepID=UPI003F93E659
MAKSAILSVRIIGDAADAIAAFDSAEKRTKGFQDGLDKASIAAGAGLAALAGFGIAAGDAASQAEQAMGAVDSVFGNSADTIHDFADAAADAVGLSGTQYRELASVFGAQLSNMGTSADELVGTTDDLIGLGSDLAATFGGSTADAVGALSSLLRGERDPIEQFGVSIKQADIEAQKAAMGLDGLTGEAERNADMQATLALLMDQTSAAQGQFAAEADTAAGQQERMNAQWQNAIAELGEQLLPIMVTAAGALAGLAQWVGENTELVTGLAIAFGVIASAVIAANIAFKTYAMLQGTLKAAQLAYAAATYGSVAATYAQTAATKGQRVAMLAGAAAQRIVTAAQWAWNAAVSANPLGIIIIAIIAIVAAIIWLWNNWDQVSAWISAAWEAVTAWIGDAWDAVIAWIVDAWESAVEWVIDAWDTVGDAFEAVGDWIGDTIDDIIGWISNLIGWIGDAVDGFLNMIGLGGEASSVQAGIQPTGLPGAPLWVTMAHQQAAQMPQPATFATASLGALPNLARAAASTSIAPTVTYNINVTGALDEDATARKIEKLLRKHQQRTGRVVTAGAR